MQETVASRLIKLRTEKQLSQKKLAEMSGIGQSAIGNIEAGVRGYGASIVKVAAALGTNPDYLTLDSDDPSPTAQSANLPTIGEEARRFQRWLYKLKDKDLRERAADAAMQVVYQAVDAQAAALLPGTTPAPMAPSKKRRAEHPTR